MGYVAGKWGAVVRVTGDNGTTRDHYLDRGDPVPDGAQNMQHLIDTGLVTGSPDPVPAPSKRAKVPEK